VDEIERIADQLERAHGGDPWYGPSLRSVLEGLDAEAAARRILPRAHTIWEIVLHVASWQREVARRLREGVAREPAAGDWPPAPAPTSSAWDEARAELEAGHADLLAALGELPAGRLAEVVGEERDRPLGSGVTYSVMLHGLVQHNVAHTAQISLLRRGLD
jgi:uncharacterized damage-inducible protein DinB